MKTALRSLLAAAALALLAGAADARHGEDDGFDFDNSGPGAIEDSISDAYERDSSGPGGGDDYDFSDRDDYDVPDRSEYDASDRADYEMADRDNSGRGNSDDRDRDGLEEREHSDNSGRGNSDDADRDRDRSGRRGGEEDNHDDHGNRGRGRNGHDDDSRGHGGATQQAHAQTPEIDTDSEGRERVAHEILLSGAKREIDQARGAGFEVISERRLEGVGGVIARLHVPEGVNLEAAIEQLRNAAPRAAVSANHVYRPARDRLTPATVAGPRTAPAANTGLLGVIDTGADLREPTLAGAVMRTRAFAGRQYTPREHGTLIAAIAANAGVRMHVADVFAANAAGEPVASADSIAEAIDWMVASRVPVINVSIEGPNNVVLADVVRRANARGHVIVAAAGNGGPLAAPAYPAALDGVVAVTAIDANGRVYRRANRGDYVTFAARGVDVAVAAGDGSAIVSGTSFAAPAVAAHIAERLPEPSPGARTRLLRAMEREAIDLGAPGRDPVYGFGEIRMPRTAQR